MKLIKGFLANGTSCEVDKRKSTRNFKKELFNQEYVFLLVFFIARGACV